MKAIQFQEKLRQLGACSDAREWAQGKTWEEVFKTCHRGDWLLWLFKKTNPESIREITLAKGHCANLARQWMKDNRSINAVDVAIRFGEGNATREELADAAYAAAYAAGGAADAAAYAAAGGGAAYAAAYAAGGAADAGGAAAYAGAAGAAYAAGGAAAGADADADAGAGAYAAGGAAGADADADAGADAGAGAGARKESLQKSADICRQYLPIEIWNL